MATYYVDKTAGSDLNSGLTAALAFATIAKWITVAADGDVVNLNGGTVASGRLTYYEPLEILSGVTGPLTIRGYGTYRPIISGLTAVATWTLDSGNIWGASRATDPFSVVFFDLNGNPTKGVEVGSKVAITAQYNWFWDDPTNTLFVYATSDPDTPTTYSAIMFTDRSRGIYLGDIDDVTIENVAVWGAAGSGIDFLRCDRYIVRDFETAYNSEDGIGDNDSTSSLMEYGSIHHNGQGKGVIASPGDGVSCHGVTGVSSSTGTIRKCLIYSNSKAGVDNVGEAIHTIDSCLIYDNYLNILAYGSLLSSVQTFTNCIIVVSATDLAGMSMISTAVLYNNTFYGQSADKTGLDINGTTPAFTLTMKNNIFSGFLVGVTKAGVGCTVTENDNCFGVNGTDSAGATAIVLDGSDVTTDPLMVDPANGNYGLLTTSPCKATGADLSGAGVARDYSGRSWRVPFDMGALAFGSFAARHNGRLLQMMGE